MIKRAFYVLFLYKTLKETTMDFKDKKEDNTTENLVVSDLDQEK